MARPAKAVNVQVRNMTNAEKSAREFVESALKGEAQDLAPPGYLTEEQKEVYCRLTDKLSESGILGDLDIYILATCAIAIDRLAYIERRINEDQTLLCDSSFMASKDKYTKDLYRCCNELCLSPQSRAKIGSLAAQAAKQKEDPLLKLVSDDDD